MSRFIVTAQSESLQEAMAELQRLFPFSEKPCELEPGVALVSFAADGPAVTGAVRAKPPLFLRHIQPVQAQVPVHGDRDDLSAMADAALRLLPELDEHVPFSVQARIFAADEPAYGRFDVNNALADALCGAGLALDVRSPGQALSVAVCPGAAYLGASRVQDNLSDWAGGCRRFARDEEMISRAEFKLLEALDAFGISLPENGLAVDLGAAPGGWTRVLRQRGLRVIAVDPAALDPRLAQDAFVRHERCTAEVFLPRAPRFDLLVNDMKMDSRDTARLSVDYARRLRTGGLAVVTLKLPVRGFPAVAHHAMALLRPHLTLLHARQLFHNRQELTLVLRKDD